MHELKIGGNAHVRQVLIGESQPVAIQTMWKDKLSLSTEYDKTQVLQRIDLLHALGCDILRFAVPCINDAEVLGKLCTLTDMPLVADIHFDYKIALRIMDFPIAKIRINPGNIGGVEKVQSVLEKAAAKNIPIRIGVNGGSLPDDLQHEINIGQKTRVEALVEAAEREMELFAKHNFTEFAVSMKASSCIETIECNKLFAKRNDVPLHIGVTEAGPLIAGLVRNTAALYDLLCNNIGNTIRVSLSDTMEKEVIAAREILLAVNDALPSTRAAGNGIRIISCPRCARCSFDTHAATEKWQNYLYSLRKTSPNSLRQITVAFMGCPVNGPGEAKDADIGITGSGDKILIFRDGKIKHRVDKEEAWKLFKDELDSL
ncbi:4-hydroxy-3-methylbut-2-en-1-yl diphosphate synthase (flavodoxin) [Spirochaetia bacterium]|nr:4-hydroxy-3-methylbut-2-en-1-yl diphosphate synthase (flavodoxin) [Spirochaetia bacterium]